MTNLEKLKERRPDLIEFYSSLNPEQLLEQICAEVLDGLAMEERVSVFMAECTCNMSDTTYTPESLKTLINQRKEADINDFCFDLVEYHENYDVDIMEEIRLKAMK